MPETALQKMTSAHLIETLPDDTWVLRVAKVPCHEITTPPYVRDAEKQGRDVVFDPNRIFPMIDHVTPAKDAQTALQAKIMRDWAKKHGLSIFDMGNNGICHALISEVPLVYPGEIAIMGDSHTCTAGALCTLSVGVGTTDLGNAIATGFFTLRPQKTIRVNLVGKLPANVYPKDTILNVLKYFGKGGIKNSVLEFHGVVDSMAGRLTMSNMVVEGGGTCGIWMVDEVTINYLWPAIKHKYRTRKQALKDLSRWNSDIDCEYADVVEIDVSKLTPSATQNYHPSDVVSVQSFAGEKPDQIVIGSCTNARLEDLRLAATIMKLLKGKVKVRTIIIPATQHIYRQALKEGLIKIFVDAGCVVINPTCGPCLGMSCGVIAEGELCYATTNRNYVGRMGKGGMVRLVSPVVAAYCAMHGSAKEPSVALCRRVNGMVSKKDQVAPIFNERKEIKPIDYRAIANAMISTNSSRNFSGRPFYLRREKVNTDEIIPANYLTEVDKQAFGAHCLEDIVVGEDRVELKRCQIIVSDIGFGDGSSREQAPWALEGIGIICVIAKSFERIFETNCINNCLLPITLPADVVDVLFEERPDSIIVVWDTPEGEDGRISWSSGEATFELSEHTKAILRKGGSTGVAMEMAARFQEEGKI